MFLAEENCFKVMIVSIKLTISYLHAGERSRSVVVCLTLDQGIAGSNLAWGTALCPGARQVLYPMLSTGSTQEDPSWHDWKIVDWDVKNLKLLSV